MNRAGLVGRPLPEVGKGTKEKQNDAHVDSQYVEAQKDPGEHEKGTCVQPLRLSDCFHLICLSRSKTTYVR
jgi:hypothetical protein